MSPPFLSSPRRAGLRHPRGRSPPRVTSGRHASPKPETAETSMEDTDWDGTPFRSRTNTCRADRTGAERCSSVFGIREKRVVDGRSVDGRSGVVEVPSLCFLVSFMLPSWIVNGCEIYGWSDYWWLVACRTSKLHLSCTNHQGRRFTCRGRTASLACTRFAVHDLLSHFSIRSTNLVSPRTVC